jgi:hypothetical protein
MEVGLLVAPPFSNPPVARTGCRRMIIETSEVEERLETKFQVISQVPP